MVRDRSPGVPHPGCVSFSEPLLAEDEAIVRHLHPHAATLVRPALCLLVLVGGASYSAALVGRGPGHLPLRLGIVALALAVFAWLVARPLVAWRSTHYVLTTHRLVVRRGLVVRHVRDLRLAGVTDVRCRQTLPQRLLGSGTVVVEAAGDGGPVVLDRVPGCEAVVTDLQHLARAERSEEPDDVLRRPTGPVVGDPRAWGWEA